MSQVATAETIQKANMTSAHDVTLLYVYKFRL